MTEEEKMMLRRLIVKEDELEELKDTLAIVQNRADDGLKWARVLVLEQKITRLTEEIEELREKLKEICGE